MSPENACGAKHFSHGVILGQPREKFRFRFDRISIFQKTLGSGLSGLRLKVRVFGFIRFEQKFENIQT